MENKLYFLFSCVYCMVAANIERPNIVFIMADDLGWSDVSYHGSDQVITPNIDTLAYQGIVLHQYYTDVSGSASRAAFFTGKYAMRFGLQAQSLRSYEDYGLPPEERLLPTHLKGLGYSTHLVGKWQLGMSRRDYLPTSRGFDSFFGFHSDGIDYYTYDHIESSQRDYFGFDLYENTLPATTVTGYITEVLTDKAVDIITNHNTSTGPLYLQVAHAAPHVGRGGVPLQAPLELIYANDHIANPARRVFAAMVLSIDNSVGTIVTALAEKSMLHNTIIIFTSDNGATPSGGSDEVNFGLNLPLRGKKCTPWDGGARVPALIWHKSLKPSIWNGLFHVSDWLPTVISAAGGRPHNEPIDGINQWDSIVSKSSSIRKEVLVAMDDLKGYAAYRYGKFKLVVGSPDIKDSGFNGSELLEMKSRASFYERAVMNCEIASVINEISNKPLDEYLISKKRNSTVLFHNGPIKDEVLCVPTQEKGCLFNINEDPFEIHDLWDTEPKVVNKIATKLRKLWSEQMSRNILLDERSKPSLHRYVWKSWSDGESLRNITASTGKFPLEFSLREMQYVVDKNVETFKDKLYKYVDSLSDTFKNSVTSLLSSDAKCAPGLIDVNVTALER